MWICLNDAFVSIVDKAKNRRRDLCVRARRQGDIEALFGVDAITTLGGDYRYRADVPRAAILAAMTTRIAGLDYPNFKDSVKDNALHDAYSAVWGIMGRLQPGGPYNTSGGRVGRYRSPSLFDSFPLPEDERHEHRHDICDCGAGFARYLSDAGRLVCDGCSRGAA